MVALDFEEARFVPSLAVKTGRAAFVPLGAAIAAVLVALAGFGTGGEGSWSYATDLVLRFATMMFAFALAFGPAGRLVLGRADYGFAVWSRMVMLGFIAAYAVFLGCVALPYVCSSVSMPLATTAFCFFNAFVLGVIAVTSAERATDTLGDRIVATLHRLSVGVFWIAFAIADLAHLYGPHRPDGFFGASLCALVAALLIRFADTLAARLRMPVAEKVV